VPELRQCERYDVITAVIVILRLLPVSCLRTGSKLTIRSGNKLQLQYDNEMQIEVSGLPGLVEPFIVFQCWDSKEGRGIADETKSVGMEQSD
jgi:hypothetical protein